MLKNKKETRNNWGLGFVYSENGFGFSSGLYVLLAGVLTFILIFISPVFLIQGNSAL
ncbi:MAG: hypothetical protein IPG09_18485 [Ignavibacteria bacterium]|nr:hypothetical protein [Ignavibacteria bacterium]